MTVATLLLFLCAPSVSDYAETLKKNAKLPYEQRERERAIRGLAKLGTVEATRVLVSLLDDPFAHLQDEAVSALITLKRAPADRRRAALAYLGKALAKSKPPVRVHLATALGLIGDQDATPALIAVLQKTKDPAAVAAIAQALARLGDERAPPALTTAARKLAHARGALLRALGTFPDGVAAVVAYQNDTGPNNTDSVRAAIVATLARAKQPIWPTLAVTTTTGEQTAIELSLSLEQHQDAARARERAAALVTHPSWRVRAAAIAGIEARRDVTLLGLLVDRLEQEPGRLRADAWNALRRLTKKDLPPDAASWRAVLPMDTWPGGDEAQATDLPKRSVAYFGLPVFSKRIAFVFDVSGSMRDDGKMERARTEFGKAVGALEKDQRYDLIAYRYLLKFPPRPKLERCFGKLVTGKSRAAKRWLQKQEAKGGGAIYDSLLAALDDPDIDTIYLLSDGVPSYGTVKRDWRVRQEIARRNRMRRVVIHTILLGRKGTDIAFMKRLAAENGGISVDQDGRRLG